MNNLMKIEIFISFLTLFIFLSIRPTEGLECYVCSNQTGNTEKCLNTIKTCEPGEDVCYTEIRWGSTPYWIPGAIKQYFVSKRCMSKSNCLNKRKRYMQWCTHIWYEDWTCSECCQGDRCNYYVISGADSLRISMCSIFAIALYILSKVF